MPSLSSLQSLLDHVGDSFDRTKFAIRQKLNRVRPVIIVPYRGFGNHQSVTIRGRVLEDTGLIKPTPEDTVWQNIIASVKRIGTLEIPFVRVEAEFQGRTHQVETDGEGYFSISLPVNASQLDTTTQWHSVELRLLDVVVEEQEEVTATGEVLIPNASVDFGVISDIDDTVLVSDVSRFLSMIRLALLENATSRLPFPGAGAFYRALQAGPDGQSHNPFFFVSSSPWNLYDLLTDFFTLHRIPKAPLMLRDLGLSESMFSKSGHGQHKLSHIRTILNTYPSLDFVLIGDSSQHDPEIYQQAVKEYPGRIRAIYIRDVTPDQRDITVVSLRDKLREQGVDLVYCEHTEDAAQHAQANNLLSADRLPDIHQEKEQDLST